MLRVYLFNNKTRISNLRVLYKYFSTEKYEHTTQSQHYDIIIVGGGLIGTTLACSLAKNKILSEKRVLLLESARKFKPFTGGEYSNRVSAINESAIELLKSINAWNTISSTRFKPVKQIQVWDACSNASITFNHEQFTKDVAYIIENNLILQAVLEQLELASNTDIKYASKVLDIELSKDGEPKSSVKLKSGEIYTCDLVIGADGFNSIVRKKMNINVFNSIYNQSALVATVDHSEPGDNSVAWQRFVPTGPVALLPLTDTQSSLVWSTTPLHAKKLVSMPPEDFVDELNEAFFKEYQQNSLVRNVIFAIDSIFGASNKTVRQYPRFIKSVDSKSRACFPLGLCHASSYVTRGAVIIGDAAHRMHPLAGQGANLGFGDIRCLTRVLSDAVFSGFHLSIHMFYMSTEGLSRNSNRTDCRKRYV